MPELEVDLATHPFLECGRLLGRFAVSLLVIDVVEVNKDVFEHPSWDGPSENVHDGQEETMKCGERWEGRL